MLFSYLLLAATYLGHLQTGKISGLYLCHVQHGEKHWHCKFTCDWSSEIANVCDGVAKCINVFG